MKTYDFNSAEETLFGLLSVQDKTMLAKELAKIMVQYSHLTNKSWAIKNLDLSLTPNGNNNFVIKVGNE